MLLTHMGLALQQELQQPVPAGRLYAETAAQMMAVHLLRHYTSAKLTIPEDTQGLSRQQMRRVIDFILAHLHHPLSLYLLAQQLGLSAYHFARLFRRTTGESPHQFVLRKRVEAAQRLLSQTDMPLAQIALEVGIANQSHFTQVFKQHLGLTLRM